MKDHFQVVRNPDSIVENRTAEFESDNATGSPESLPGMQNICMLIRALDTGDEKHAKFYIGNVVIPSLCILGVIGNVVNIIVFVRRRMRIVMECMEKCAIVGLISIALSDLLFCAFTAIRFFLPEQKIFYTSRNLAYYFELYGILFQNVFIKTSTWLTVITATSRYIAICHPLKARFNLDLKYIKLIICLTFPLWFLLHLPLLWRYKVESYDCGSETYHLLEFGVFYSNTKLRHTFTYLWAFLGYFIPVMILVYCNVCLVRTLRASLSLRQQGSTLCGSSPSRINRRITLTLVTVVLAFIVLVSPSEILHFCDFVRDGEKSPTDADAYEIALLCTNILQAINFSFNFLLYCAINNHFRKSIKDCVSSVLNYLRPKRYVDEPLGLRRGSFKNMVWTPMPRTSGSQEGKAFKYAVSYSPAVKKTETVTLRYTV